MNAAFARLADALALAQDAGRPARFWLRDDDAVAPTLALERLLSLSEDYDVALALAVIPAAAQRALAERLVAAKGTVALVHGWQHANHAQPPAKKCELGADRPGEQVLSELRLGLSRIAELFGEQHLPVLVPPWNRIDRALLPRLPDLGFRAVSVFGAPGQGPLPEINTSVDIIDWHGTRGGREAGSVVAEVAAAVERQASDACAPAIGVLTHHLVHDQAAWDLLARLMEATAGRARWIPVDALLVAGTQPT